MNLTSEDLSSGALRDRAKVGASLADVDPMNLDNSVRDESFHGIVVLFHKNSNCPYMVTSLIIHILLIFHVLLFLLNMHIYIFSHTYCIPPVYNNCWQQP